MKAKVERVVYRDSSENTPVLFENGVFLKKNMIDKTLLFGDEKPNDIRTKVLLLELTLDFCGRKYKRDGTIECCVDSFGVVEERKMTPICVPSKDNLNLKELEKHSGMKRVALTIAPVEFKKKLLELIPEIEKGFYISEDELLNLSTAKAGRFLPAFM